MAAPSERMIHSHSSATPRDAKVFCGRDKSLTHRAVMFASLASGYSRIHYPLLGADCISSMDCFRALGVSIEQKDPNTIAVLSRGYQHFSQPTRDLDCGNSGTTARLLTGILAAQAGLRCRLTGDASLSQRPMHRVVLPLREMGAKIDGPGDANYLPLQIEGKKLKAMAHTVDKASAQVKSALLLAGLFCEGTSDVTLPSGSRDHTERMLEKMGAPIRTKIQNGRERIHLDGPFSTPAKEFVIPVDPSSAAFFAVFGLLRSGASIEMPHVLDNPTRTGFIKVLQRMSPALEIQTETSQAYVEPVMTLCVKGGTQLRATTISPDEVPTLVDEIPILAVAAAFANGPSHFRGLSELRVKESDRLNKTAELLQLAGAGVRIDGDDLLIDGGLQNVQPFRYDPHGDHRLAMAAAILARRSEKPCCILDPECVRVSFPDFYEVLDSVIG